jgi:gamma-glutamyltranspeptidase/glutathione hydrolase
MVAAADPRAVDAGLEMLAAGGTATDAAIAAMAVLGLVEPQSAGVGGGGFMVAYDKASGAVNAYDGREAAPAAATGDYFRGPDGKPLPFGQAIQSGLSTGAPSLYAMLKLAHDDSGKLPWAKLFEPAIKLADDGFVVGPRMHNSIVSVANRGALKQDPAALAYFFTPDGQPLPVGFVRKNPEYAATLRAIAAKGPKALQEGPIAEAIIKAVHQAPRPGQLTLADLKNVKPRKLPALCGMYRVYKVCGPTPPSSGGVAVAELLGLYARARPHPEGVNSADDWAAFMWASRLAYVDRDWYVGDDAFTPMPLKAMVSANYLDQRAKLIDVSKAPAQVEPGDPAAAVGEPSLRAHWGGVGGKIEGGTTHMSIIDKYGNAVAMTASVESVLGSQRMAAGFMLNNQLTDFSFIAAQNGRPVANAVAAGKKPRSSMSPTIIFDQNGNVYALIGSPGGSSIIAYVAKTIIALIDWKLPMQQAIDTANVVGADTTIRIERDRFAQPIADELIKRGWTLRQNASEESGLQGIVVRPGGLEGGADSRREGVAKLAP